MERSPRCGGLSHGGGGGGEDCYGPAVFGAKRCCGDPAKNWRTQIHKYINK